MPLGQIKVPITTESRCQSGTLTLPLTLQLTLPIKEKRDLRWRRRKKPKSANKRALLLTYCAWVTHASKSQSSCTHVASRWHRCRECSHRRRRTAGVLSDDG